MFSIFCTHMYSFSEIISDQAHHIVGRDFCQNVLFQKTSIFLPQMGLECTGSVVGKGSSETKKCKGM